MYTLVGRVTLVTIRTIAVDQAFYTYVVAGSTTDLALATSRSTRRIRGTPSVCAAISAFFGRFDALVVDTFPTRRTIRIRDTLLTLVVRAHQLVTRTRRCLRCRHKRTFHTGVTCTVLLDRVRRTRILAITVVVVVRSRGTVVRTFHTLEVFTVRFRFIRVFLTTGVVIRHGRRRTFHTLAVLTEILLVVLLAEGRESGAVALHTHVVGVTERTICVLTTTCCRLLVRFGTFHTSILLAERHARIDRNTSIVQFRCIRTVGTLRTHIVFARQAIAILRVAGVPLGRTLAALVIDTELVIGIDRRTG